MKDDRILVAVFDSAHARFFEFKEAHAKLEVVLGEVSSQLHHDHRDIDSDKPGRGFSSGGQHHSYESPSDPRKLEKHNFVRAIADAIEAALDAHKFGRLAIVAPSRSVGEFRSVASPKVLKVLWREVPKELSNLTDAQLHERLVPELRKLTA